VVCFHAVNAPSAIRKSIDPKLWRLDYAMGIGAVGKQFGPVISQGDCKERPQYGFRFDVRQNVVKVFRFDVFEHVSANDKITRWRVAGKTWNRWIVTPAWQLYRSGKPPTSAAVVENGTSP